jgi:hypothetical protein
MLITVIASTRVFILQTKQLGLLDAKIAEPKDEPWPQMDQNENSKMFVASHDLEVFKPLINASIMFTPDNFEYAFLKNKVEEGGNYSKLITKSPRFQWMIPEQVNFINSSMLQLLTTAETTFEDKGERNHNICQIICRFQEQVTRHYLHFPHFMQQALPCYNMFHYFSKVIHTDQSRKNSLHNYMILPDRVKSISGFSPYIQNFLIAMEGHPYYVQMIYGFDENIPVHQDCTDMSQSTTSTTSAILASKTFGDSGWDHPVRYFMELNPNEQKVQVTYDNYELIQQIQYSILGEDYRAGPSALDFDKELSTILKEKHQSYQAKSIQCIILQVLILDRKTRSREFTNVDKMISFLQNYTVNYKTTRTSLIQFRLNVTYVPSFMRITLREQAYFMHQADIIYTPHGAQLTNAIFIRPCTVVLEFFPRSYYLQFFQSMVLAAHGIPLEGYPHADTNDTDKVTDTFMTKTNFFLQKQAKNVVINVTEDFLEMTLPQIINVAMKCRKKAKRLANEAAWSN